MANVDPGLAHRVRLLHHLDQAALLQPLHSLELGKVVQGVAVQLEGETGAVACVLPVHQQLVDLLDQLHGGNLNGNVLTSSLHTDIEECQPECQKVQPQGQPPSL